MKKLDAKAETPGKITITIKKEAQNKGLSLPMQKVFLESPLLRTLLLFYKETKEGTTGNFIKKLPSSLQKQTRICEDGRRTIEREHQQMNRWLQSRMQIKRVYFLIGGGLFVLLVAFALAALFIKSGSAPSGTTAQSSVNEGENTALAAQTDETPTVERIPLNKTLDEAKAEGLHSNARTTHSASGHTNEGTSDRTKSTSAATSADSGNTSEKEQAAVSGEGLDANTVSQLRSHGIREGDLAKIDRMVAEGFDPKEIAQSLRKNGNPNLANVMDQVPRKPKPKKSSAQEDTATKKQDVSALYKDEGNKKKDSDKQQEDSDE
ncbi:hypothetical protein JQN58_14445 [Aneurinibacillus sp. BA2021]|nr:hypothetical protein [Aneurinibacillus sp. BA2021]